MPNPVPFTITFAPETAAPLASVTVPLMLAVVCPGAALLKPLSSAPSKKRRKKILSFIDDPLTSIAIVLFLPSDKQDRTTAVNIPRSGGLTRKECSARRARANGASHISSEQSPLRSVNPADGGRNQGARGEGNQS